MKILITGAFGNIGGAIIEEAHRRQHEVIVFEIDTEKNRRAARKYRGKIQKVIFGDIRNFKDVKEALLESESVIHLAGIIPPLSKKNRELTMDVNYGGTANLVNAIRESNRDIPLIFTSSVTVMGATQLQQNLVSRHDPLVITGNYEESKIKCEEFLTKHAENYLAFRLAGVLPKFSVRSFRGIFPLIEEIFDMHPEMRLELISADDVATALLTGAEKLKSCKTPQNQVYILGGGAKNGWQLSGGEFINRLFGALSLPVPDRKYFTQDINNYHLDWYDTREAEEEFDFQHTSIEDYLNCLRKSFRPFKLPILLFRGPITTWL
ncbi:MAG TPA: NAD(P)-dependent oxidoreductase, partial [Methanomicrobiales archaeon]|nr:NAD(P)-dependent oxidoreductase [Methanomicrobiales archaeon]